MTLISEKEIEELARVSRITLSSDELERYCEMLTGMVSFASLLDDEGAGAFASAECSREAASGEALREDTVRESLSKEALLSLSTSHNGDFLLVPRAVEE